MVALSVYRGTRRWHAHVEAVNSGALCAGSGDMRYDSSGVSWTGNDAFDVQNVKKRRRWSSVSSVRNRR